jgi:hypothetical protein
VLAVLERHHHVPAEIRTAIRTFKAEFPAFRLRELAAILARCSVGSMSNLSSPGRLSIGGIRMK